MVLMAPVAMKKELRADIARKIPTENITIAHRACVSNSADLLPLRLVQRTMTAAKFPAKDSADSLIAMA
jgi:hypothetical protein